MWTMLAFYYVVGNPKKGVKKNIHASFLFKKNTIGIVLHFLMELTRIIYNVLVFASVYNAYRLLVF